MTPFILIGLFVAVIALAAWACAVLLESAAAKFYHSYPAKHFRIPEAVLSGTVYCPYCKSLILPGDAIMSCCVCKTMHHYECWDTTSNCSVFGCEGIKGSLL